MGREISGVTHSPQVTVREAKQILSLSKFSIGIHFPIICQNKDGEELPYLAILVVIPSLDSIIMQNPQTQGTTSCCLTIKSNQFFFVPQMMSSIISDNSLCQTFSHLFQYSDLKSLIQKFKFLTIGTSSKGQEQTTLVYKINAYPQIALS